MFQLPRYDKYDEKNKRTAIIDYAGGHLQMYLSNIEWDGRNWYHPTRWMTMAIGFSGQIFSPNECELSRTLLPYQNQHEKDLEFATRCVERLHGKTLNDVLSSMFAVQRFEGRIDINYRQYYGFNNIVEWHGAEYGPVHVEVVARFVDAWFQNRLPTADRREIVVSQ